jgi:hypothetical protein
LLLFFADPVSTASIGDAHRRGNPECKIECI